MIVFYFLICTFFHFSLSTAQAPEAPINNISTITNLFDGNGWKISVQAKDPTHFNFNFGCDNCPFLIDWEGLSFYVNFTQYPTTVKPVQDLKKEGYPVAKVENAFRIYRKYSLKYSNNDFITDNTFSLTLEVVFAQPVPDLNQIINSFYINNKLIFGHTEIQTQYPCRNDITAIRKSCHAFAKSIDYFIPSLEATIFFNYTRPEFRRGVFLTLIMQDVLKEILSADFKVEKIDDNLWMLKDFGYYWRLNTPIEVNLTLIADDLIQNPIPLSILLNDEILCGFYPRSHISSCIFGGAVLTRNDEIDMELTKGDGYKTLRQNSVMLTILITFIVIFGIYTIAATYQLICWKRHYNQMALELWNRIQCQGDNNFDNFASSTEYANAIM